MPAERGQPFLSPEDLKKSSLEWQQAARDQEGKGYRYVTTRQEYLPGDTEFRTSEDIEHLHGVSFLRDTIPQLIDQKTHDGPVRILDIGGGEGFYAEQIRETFLDAVKVYTTGLRKKPAQELRDLQTGDLKWRSVLQLSDYPEFDLMLDTYGEATYSLKDMEHFHKYMEALIGKLQHGGVASLIVGSTFSMLSEEDRKKAFRTIVTQYGCEVYQRSQRVQIYKPKIDESAAEAKNSFVKLLHLPDFLKSKK